MIPLVPLVPAVPELPLVPVDPEVPEVPPPTIKEASIQVPDPALFMLCDVGLPVKAVSSM